eukprot:m.59380 g.59380  ORF g.59380 m.59380 type:complete len:307 (+) comp13817_c0_seq5:90-1010(+)
MYFVFYGIAICCLLSSQPVKSQPFLLFEGRAQAWTTCVRSSAVPKVAKWSFEASVCQLPTRTLVHIHVFKSGGTILMRLLEAVCRRRQGVLHYFPGRNRSQFDRFLTDDLHPKLFFSSQREPVERFYSALAELARRGLFSKSFYARAAKLKDPLKLIQWSLKHPQALPKHDPHLASAVSFLSQDNDPSGIPWPIDYIVDPHQPGELELLWRLLINGTDLPYPRVDGRHSNDPEYQLCQDGRPSCTHASSYTRSLMHYIVMQAQDSTAWMNTTLRHMYREDEECYRAATAQSAQQTASKPSAVTLPT